MDNDQSNAGEEIDLDKPIAVQKGVRSCTNHPISNFVSYHRLSTSLKAFVTHLDSKKAMPKNVYEALKIPEWREAVMEEMRALEKNGTWKITDLPSGKRPVGYKWVFTVKHNSDGKLKDTRPGS